MLASSVRSKSCVCNNYIRQINCTYKINNRGITTLNENCLDSFKQCNIINNTNKIFRYWNSIVCKRKSCISYTYYYKDLKLFYSSKPTNIAEKKPSGKENDTGASTTKPKKPKKEIKTYITLIGVDNNISVSTVEEANKLADRRNLKLVKVVDFDPKSSRAVYKLMTDSQYLREDWNDSKTKKDQSHKDEKLVSLSSNTSENDVLTKLKMIQKWLTKQIEVRVVISGAVASGENVYKIIEKGLGNNGRIVQKRAKNSMIRFQILPPKKSEEKVPNQSENE